MLKKEYVSSVDGYEECQTESRQKGNGFLQEISAKCSLILLTQTDGAAARDRVHHSYAPSRGQHRRHCRLEALMFAVQRPGGTAGLHRIFCLSYLVYMWSEYLLLSSLPHRRHNHVVPADTGQRVSFFAGLLGSLEM